MTQLSKSAGNGSVSGNTEHPSPARALAAPSPAAHAEALRRATDSARRLAAIVHAAETDSGDLLDHAALGRAHDLIQLADQLALELVEQLDTAHVDALSGELRGWASPEGLQ